MGKRKTPTYHATAKIQGVQYYLGRFPTKEQAKEERDSFYYAYCPNPDSCLHPYCKSRRLKEAADE
jgi:hypothetical protein